MSVVRPELLGAGASQGAWPLGTRQWYCSRLPDASANSPEFYTKVTVEPLSLGRQLSHRVNVPHPLHGLPIRLCDLALAQPKFVCPFRSPFPVARLAG